MTNEEAKEMLHNVRVETFYRYPAMNEALKLAISTLEKQIPKKPENHSGRYYDNLCPLCGKRIKSGQGSSSRQRTNWCNHCGQAIDWGDKKLMNHFTFLYSMTKAYTK